jgi:homoserine kinase
MKTKKIKVFAPATVSNVGPGFDLMGFAINGVGDELEVSISNADGVRIKKIFGDNNRLPYNPYKNTAAVSILSLLESYQIKIGLDIVIWKKMGIGSGLGSSAASAVAGVFAANKLLGLNLSKQELLKHALAGELIASKSIHADNAAPCLFGGFVLIRSYNPIDIVKIDYPHNLFCSIIYPDIEIKTSDARKILDKKVERKIAIAQAGNASGLIAGLIKKDFKLISRSMEDFIAEPKRAQLIPCYNEMKNAALTNGALNCNISGSGPSMFSFSTSEKEAHKIVNAMKKTALKNGIKSKTFVSKINGNGTSVIK